MDCKCDKGNKNIIFQREFLYDHQNGYLKHIGTLDRVETNNIAKRNKRILSKKKNEIAERDIKGSKRDILINSAQNI